MFVNLLSEEVKLIQSNRILWIQKIYKMILSDCWVKSILLITTVTLLRPTTASFGDLLNVVTTVARNEINTCQYSACEFHPKCSSGYDTLSTTREGKKNIYLCARLWKSISSGCSGVKEKKYCCRSGTGPQCFFTGCNRETACPGNYRELDRTKSGCSGFAQKAYCCKTTHLPTCFDMSCPAFAESAKSCPSEYNESRRAKGRSAGCDSAFAERLTCCLQGNNYGNRNSNDNTDVVSETQTKTLPDGTVQTVTKTQTHSRTTGGSFNF